MREQNDQKLPDGKCHGREMPDRGTSTGVTDTYGAGNGALNRGFTDRAPMGRGTETKRD